jgi:phospholipase A-2-activating protein
LQQHVFALAEKSLFFSWHPLMHTAAAALLLPRCCCPAGPLDELLGGLAAAVSANPAAAFSEEAITLAGNLLRWPAAQLFPGLDIARCLALHPAAADALAAAAGSMSAPTLGGLSGALAAAAVSELAPALQTALRLAANCFKAESLRSWALANRELLLDGFAGCCSAGGPGASKGVRLSAATLLLNFSIAAAAGNPGGASSSSGFSAEGCMQLLSGLEELLKSVPVEEGDAAQRSLLALGTLVVAGGGEVAAVARDLGLGGQAARWAAAGGKLGGVAQEVQALLR